MVVQSGTAHPTQAPAVHLSPAGQVPQLTVAHPLDTLPQVAVPQAAAVVFGMQQVFPEQTSPP
jgi:hypothetical protein